MIYSDKSSLEETQKVLHQAQSKEASYNLQYARWIGDHNYTPYILEPIEFRFGEFPTGKELQTNWSEVMEDLYYER